LAPSPLIPHVPRLPDGAEGRFYEAETGDWPIVWSDPPGDHETGCQEIVLWLKMPNLSSEQQKTELVKVARSMVHIEET
jgi:hypothetical protein